MDSEAFYALIEEVVQRMREKQGHLDKWIDEAEAMRLLRITSKTTISKLRNNGDIRYSQPRRKIILLAEDVGTG